MSNSVKMEKRIVCSTSGLSDFLSEIEISYDKTRIRAAILRHAAIVGVPRKIVSVIIDERLLSPKFNDPLMVVEIGRKKGKFDGRERPQISLRPCLRGILTGPADPPVMQILDTIKIMEYSVNIGNMELCSLPPRLRVAPLREADDDFKAIARWQWSRFFNFLKYDEVSDILAGFELLGSETITEANRRAGRALYRRARELGWRKMTARELGKNGFSADSGCWHMASVVAEKNGSPTGCGEYTLTAANSAAI